VNTVELLDRRWRIEQCSARDCGADIVFATNPGTGSRMPVDAAPVHDGQWRLADEGGVEPFAEFAARDPEVVAASQAGMPIPLHKSHFATCTTPKRVQEATMSGARP